MRSFMPPSSARMAGRTSLCPLRMQKFLIPSVAASLTTTAVAGAVVSKPTAMNTTVLSGLSRANCSASSLLRTTRTLPFGARVSSEPLLPGTRIMSP